MLIAPTPILICSLPGAGGSVLSSILMQNPALWPSGHSPRFEFFHQAARLAKQLYPQLTDEQGPHDAFYYQLLRAPLQDPLSLCGVARLVDKTGTGPLEHLSLLTKIAPDSKIILVVRDLRAQITSLAIRNISVEQQQRFELGLQLSLEQVENLLELPVLKLGLQRITDYLAQPRAGNVFLLTYEQLCLAPNSQLRLLYDFLEIPFFVHSYDTLFPLPLDRQPTTQVAPANIRSTLEDRGARWIAYMQPVAEHRLMMRFKRYYEHFYPEYLLRNPENLKVIAQPSPNP